MTEQQIRIFTSTDGQAQLEMVIGQETVWLHQTQMCELFDLDQSVIFHHICSVFKEGEVPAESNMQKMHIESIRQELKAVNFQNQSVI